MPERLSLALATTVALPPNGTGFGLTTGLRVGVVKSMLMPVCVLDALLPALSVHVPIALWLTPSLLMFWLTLVLAAPEVASPHVQFTVTALLFQPLAFAAVRFA